MIEVSLSKNNGNGYKWFSTERVSVKGYLFTKEGVLYKDKHLLDYFLPMREKADFIEKIATATGLFSVIIHDGKRLLAATDIVRTFPLFYTQSGDNFHISDTTAPLLKEVPSSLLNERSVLQFEAIVYVLGRDTLINNVFQVQAGEAVSYDETGFSRRFYADNPFRQPISEMSKAQLNVEFNRMLSLLSKRLSAMIDGRPVVLPLSGGYDSRLLACLLKSEGYENVTCFTYGSTGTPERENARKTAEALGYKWFFIDYCDYLNEDVSGSKQFEEWIDFTSCHSSFFYFQEYLAARTLKEKKLIPSDAVIIPGHTADVTAGGHLMQCMAQMDSLPSLVRYASLKSITLKRLKKEERKALDKDIARTMCYYNTEPVDYRWYEQWQTKERQAKQIVNSSKIWDFFGFQYILPFWDELFVSFFSSLPFSYKVNKNFYNEAVNELFAEKGVSLGHNSRSSQFAIWKQQVKLRLMKIPPLHSLLYRNNLWKADYACYRHFTKKMVADLERSGNYKGILRFNGILSAWYLLYIRRKDSLSSQKEKPGSH